MIRPTVPEDTPGLVALAVAAVACEFVLPPILAGTGGALNSVIGDLVYPLGDLLLRPLIKPRVI